MLTLFQVMATDTVVARQRRAKQRRRRTISQLFTWSKTRYKRNIFPKSDSQYNHQ